MAREELASTRPRQPDHVLQVRRRRRDRADRGGVERAADDHERQGAEDAAAHLEALRVDVLVRDAVAEEVKERPERRRGERGANKRAADGSRGKVERDDQCR